MGIKSRLRSRVKTLLLPTDTPPRPPPLPEILNSPSDILSCRKTNSSSYRASAMSRLSLVDPIAPPSPSPSSSYGGYRAVATGNLAVANDANNGAFNAPLAPVYPSLRPVIPASSDRENRRKSGHRSNHRRHHNQHRSRRCGGGGSNSRASRGERRGGAKDEREGSVVEPAISIQQELPDEDEVEEVVSSSGGSKGSKRRRKSTRGQPQMDARGERVHRDKSSKNRPHYHQQQKSRSRVTNSGAGGDGTPSNVDSTTKVVKKSDNADAESLCETPMKSLLHVDPRYFSPGEFYVCLAVVLAVQIYGVYVTTLDTIEFKRQHSLRLKDQRFMFFGMAKDSTNELYRMFYALMMTQLWFYAGYFVLTLSLPHFRIGKFHYEIIAVYGFCVATYTFGYRYVMCVVALVVLLHTLARGIGNAYITVALLVTVYWTVCVEQHANPIMDWIVLSKYVSPMKDFLPFKLIDKLTWANFKLCMIHSSIFIIEYSNSGFRSQDFKVIHFLTYIFYFPNMFSGSVLLYDDFKKQTKFDNVWYEGRQRKLVNKCIKWAVSFVAMEIAHCLMFIRVIGNDASRLKSFSGLETYAFAITNIHIFSLTYLVKRGLANIVASFDGISIVENPETIMKCYRITMLWRVFNRGMFKCIHRYIYAPLCGESPTALHNIVALVVSYSILLVYYGLHSAKSRALTIFFTLSMLEVLACRTQMSLMYFELENGYLNSKKKRRRFSCLILGALIYPMYYAVILFLNGDLTADILFWNIYGNFYSTLLVVIIGYCTVQVAMPYERPRCRPITDDLMKKEKSE